MNIKLSTLFISIIGAIVFITTTNATTMCVTNDNTNISLDPSVAGEYNAFDKNTATWTATFSYGTLSGWSTCNSVSGTNNTAYPEYNFDNNHASSEGVYCWCRMTSPVRSAWVCRGQLGTENDCKAGCAYTCGYLITTNENYRRTFYTSAGN